MPDVAAAAAAAAAACRVTATPFVATVRAERVSQPFLAGLADLYFAAPLRLEHLGRRDSAGRVGIEYRVYDIPAAGLSQWLVST